MFKHRLISSAIIISFFILSLFFDLIFNIFAISLIVLGLNEFFGMVEKKGLKVYRYFGIFIGLLIPLSIAFRFELTKNWELLFIVLTLITLIILQFRIKDSSNAVVGISVTMFGVLYVAWFFSFIIKIHNLPNGMGLVASLIMVTKGADIGAYLVGTRWGKTPFIAHISPKKSVEGAIGGLLFSVLFGIAARPLLDVTYLQAAVLALAFGFIGQLGDLSESLLKRDCQIKDSSILIPGIGGTLDLIDSLLFSAPVFYFYFSRVLLK